jgi:hypothetical protein
MADEEVGDTEVKIWEMRKWEQTWLLMVEEERGCKKDEGEEGGDDTPTRYPYPLMYLILTFPPSCPR